MTVSSTSCILNALTLTNDRVEVALSVSVGQGGFDVLTSKGGLLLVDRLRGRVAGGTANGSGTLIFEWLILLIGILEIELHLVLNVDVLIALNCCQPLLIINHCYRS